MKLFEKIKKARLEMKLTQLELAKLLGLSVSQSGSGKFNASVISRYEMGTRVPSYDVLLKMSKLCKKKGVEFDLNN